MLGDRKKTKKKDSSTKTVKVQSPVKKGKPKLKKEPQAQKKEDK
jgi:hypothetical protein